MTPLWLHAAPLTIEQPTHAFSFYSCKDRLVLVVVLLVVLLLVLQLQLQPLQLLLLQLLL